MKNVMFLAYRVFPYEIVFCEYLSIKNLRCTTSAKEAKYTFWRRLWRTETPPYITALDWTRQQKLNNCGLNQTKLFTCCNVFGNEGTSSVCSQEIWSQFPYFRGCILVATLLSCCFFYVKTQKRLTRLFCTSF